MKYISYITLILFANLSAVHAELHQKQSMSMWHKIASLFHTDDDEIKDNFSSLLATDKMSNEFNETVNSKKESAPDIQGTYYLSSIIFSNNRNWSIWLNEQIITPSQMHQLSHISIKRVSADKVECQIANQKKTLLLCPNQTLDLSNGNVLNGDQRKAIITTSEDDDDDDFTLTESP